jgi:CBS domain-containing protein
MECPACGHEFLAGQDVCDDCGQDLTHVGLPVPKLGPLHELILEDPISQLNAPPPITLGARDSVGRAVDLMRKHRYGSVLVVTPEGKLAGIFTEGDLVRKLSRMRRPLESVLMEEVLTPDPQALTDESTIAQALHCMAVGGYRHIPVVRDGQPVGFVSIRGILTYIAKNAL